MKEIQETLKKAQSTFPGISSSDQKQMIGRIKRDLPKLGVPKNSIESAILKLKQSSRGKETFVLDIYELFNQLKQQGDINLNEAMEMVTSDKAYSEIQRIITTIESVKGAKGLNRAMLTKMRKALNMLKRYMTDGEKLPGLLLKETQEDFKKMKQPVEKKGKK